MGHRKQPWIRERLTWNSLHHQPAEVPDFKAGDRVRLTRAARRGKQYMRVRFGNGTYSKEWACRQHVQEFRRCVGIVVEEPGGIEGCIDVRWQPSNLRYGYLPHELQHALPWERSPKKRHYARR